MSANVSVEPSATQPSSAATETELSAATGAAMVGYNPSGTVQSVLAAVKVTADAAATSSALTTHAALTTAHGSTALNTASAIVQRDSSGNFAAGTITAALTGTASGNLANTGGQLTGNITFSGAQTVDGRDVSADGASLDAVIAAPVLTASATAAYSGESNLGALTTGLLKISVSGGTATPSTATAGTDYETAGTSATHAALTSPHSATALNTADRLVLRDSSGNFAAGTITASLTGTASGNQPLDATLTALAALASDGLAEITGSGATAAVRAIGVGASTSIPTRADADARYDATGTTSTHAALTAPHSATATNTADRLVLRDGSGNFAAGTVTASLTGAASLNILSTAKGAASGVASLNGSTLVVENPANATQTPTASKIPIANSGNTQLAQGWIGSNAGAVGRVLLDLGDGTSKFVPATGSSGVTVSATGSGLAISGASGGATTSLFSASGVTLTTTEWYRAQIPTATDSLQSVVHIFQSSSVSNTYDASELAADTDLLTRASRVEMDPSAGDTYVSRIVGTATTALLDYATPQWTVGAGSISASGSELVLNGSTYITSADNRLTTLLQGTGDWTIEGWIQGTPTNGSIFGSQAINNAASNSSWCIAFGAGTAGKLELFVSTSGSAWTSAPLLASTTSVNDGVRRHFAFVRNGGTCRLYIGGTQEASTSYAGSIFASTRAWSWGGFSDGGTKSTVNAHLRVSDSCLYPSGTGFTPVDPLAGPTWTSTGYGYSTLALNAAETSNLASITLTETTPNSSTVKYAFSFDNGTTFETYNGSSWSAITLANVPASGMTGANVQTYLNDIETKMQVAAAVTRIAYGLTSNSGYAPTVDPSFGIDSTLYTLLKHGTDFIARASAGAWQLQAVTSSKTSCTVRVFG